VTQHHLARRRTGSVAQSVFEHAAESPDKIALRWLEDGEGDGVTWTYATLDYRARQVGAAIRDKVPAGSRVLIMSPPGLDYVAGFLGCLYAGVVAVPAYPPSPFTLDRGLERLRGMVQSAEATVALTTTEFLELAEAAHLSVGGTPVSWLCTDGVAPGLLLDAAEPVNEDDIAFLQYTSGSTSEPKGVMVTHRCINANLATMIETYSVADDFTVASWLPPYHDMGLIGMILCPMHYGQQATLMPPASFLRRPMRWLRAISRFGLSVTASPNFGYEMCVTRNSPSDFVDLDLSGFKIAINGAEPVLPAVLERFVETFEPYGFQPDAMWPSYGLAEATLLVSGGQWTRDSTPITVDAAALSDGRIEDAVEGHTVLSCGTPVDDWTVRIVDPASGQTMLDERIGEIVIQGESVAAGYWAQPEATAEVFTTEADGTRSFRTGDQGFVRDGAVFVTGRLKDLIIIRGRNHYPQDIEMTVAGAHPELRPGCAAVFTVAGPDGEHLAVVQEVRSAESADIEQVAGTIREAVTSAHQIAVDAVVLLAPRTIPKTSSGKIRRSATKQRFVDGELEPLFQWRSRAMPDTARAG
jgi:acyl-CoA synthetase (AMP-forming)/AMP-acid ligase II